MIRCFAFAFALLMAVPAFATDWNWDLGSNPSKPGVRHVRHYYRHVNIEAENKGDRDRKDRDRERADAGWSCLDKVRGLGTQWIGTEGALEAAKKDWMERVRYDHGESYIDMTNAKDFESRCGRVSIGEVVGQVTYRCEIMARPCKPPMKEASKSAK